MEYLPKYIVDGRKEQVVPVDCRDYSLLETGKIIPFVTETFVSGHFIWLLKRRFW